MIIRIRNHQAVFILFTVVLMLGACTQTPDPSRVTLVVEQRLSEAFDSKTLDLISLRRMGSTPLGATDDGKSQRIVYYNAVFRFERDYSFSDWNSLSFASFANLMGATRLGIKGISQGGNSKGDILYIHGRVRFVFDDKNWVPADFVAREPSPGLSAISSSPGALQQHYLSEINNLVSQQTADPKQQAEILEDELKKTYTSMRLRLGRLGKALVVAGGVEQGEYAKVVETLVDALRSKGFSAVSLTTEGSLENLKLLREGKADVALVQNDIAKMSGLGSGVFQSDGPDYSLRALASLFPETLHIIVNENSAMTVLEDLRGKKVDLGKPNSGSKINSLSLLQAAGIQISELHSIHENGLKEGIKKLVQGEVDAVVTTINAPANALQISAANENLRFISVPEKVIAKMIAGGNEFIRFQLSPYTYPKQAKKISTVAVTGMLVGPDTLAANSVKLVLAELFENIDFASIGSAAGSHINRATASQAITLPMHEAAIQYFSQKSKAGSVSETTGL